MPNCYYYDEQRNRCNCYVNENLNELLSENVKLRDLATGLYRCWLGEGCDGCPMQDSDGWCVRDIRLRELGIEATE